MCEMLSFIPAEGWTAVFNCRNDFWGRLPVKRKKASALKTGSNSISNVVCSSRISAEGSCDNDVKSAFLPSRAQHRPVRQTDWRICALHPSPTEDGPVMALLFREGESLPKSESEMADGATYFPPEEVVGDGAALCKFLQQVEPTQRQDSCLLLGVKRGGRFGWIPLDRSTATISRVADDILVFRKLMPVATSGEDRRLEPVVFTPLPTNFQIPFKGREKVMESVAVSINKYYEAVQSGSVSRENMLFIAFEGLAGVGKTRCLLEVIDQTLMYLPLQSGLRHLYSCGAVQGTYITFNGSAIGGRSSHLPPNFEQGIPTEKDGRLFMRACIVAENMYARPFVDLPKDVQQEIQSESEISSMKRVADHIRKSCQLPPDQVVVLYVLVDEPQLLALKIGANGSTFLNGMFGMIGEFMTCTTGTACFEECNLILIPVVAGTVVPVVGHFGVTDWQKVVKRLDVLDVESAVEALKDALKCDDFQTYSEQVKILLEDCSCLPRLVKYTFDAWRRAKNSGMTELMTYLRTSLIADIQTWTDTILSGNRLAVERMLRLCLTGDVVEHPGEVEMGECLRGYVSWVETNGGYQYQASALVLHALACRFKKHTNIVLLRPETAKGDILERAFLDGIHARLGLNEGAECALRQLLPGVWHQGSICDTVVKIGRNVVFVEEKFQFIIPSKNGKNAHFRHEGDRHLETSDNRRFDLPRANLLTKVRDGGYVVDGRLFLEGNISEILELWFQFKGKEARLSENEVDKLVNAALDPKLNVPGRRKVYVLVSKSGFSFTKLDKWNSMDVLLFDDAGLDRFLPGFLRRCI